MKNMMQMKYIINQLCKQIRGQTEDIDERIEKLNYVRIENYTI